MLKEADGDKIFEYYETKDLRMSLVWRSRCFATEEDKKRFHSMDRSFYHSFFLPHFYIFSHSLLRSKVTSDEIFDVFRGDLEKKGVLEENQEINVLDLSLLIMQHYITFIFQY